MSRPPSIVKQIAHNMRVRPPKVDQRDEDGFLPLKPNETIHGTWYKDGVVEEMIEAERKRCCEDVCESCDAGHVSERNAAGQWKHGNIFCAAWAIHERAAKEKEA